MLGMEREGLLDEIGRNIDVVLQDGNDVAGGKDEAGVECVGDSEASVRVRLWLGSGHSHEVDTESLRHLFNFLFAVRRELVDAYQLVILARLLGKSMEKNVISTRSLCNEDYGM